MKVNGATQFATGDELKQITDGEDAQLSSVNE
jgi:hypothetical protein